MSTHHVSYPRRAKWSMAEASGWPGTKRSNVGVDAIDEPCTNRMVPSGPGAVPAAFSHRNRRVDPLCVQCSRPTMLGSAVISGSSCTPFLLSGESFLLFEHGRGLAVDADA